MHKPKFRIERRYSGDWIQVESSYSPLIAMQIAADALNDRVVQNVRILVGYDQDCQVVDLTPMIGEFRS